MKQRKRVTALYYICGCLWPKHDMRKPKHSDQTEERSKPKRATKSKARKDVK